MESFEPVVTKLLLAFEPLQDGSGQQAESLWRKVGKQAASGG